MADQISHDHISLATALYVAAKKLASVSETPRLDAELLAAHALGLGKMEMLTHLPDLAVPTGFAALIDRRIAHEPLAYITGSQAFWDLELRVTPDVLVPRSDSETLIEAALEAFSKAASPPRMILDLGTGSGALLLAALSEFPVATGIGIDASNAALAVAKDNAISCNLTERTTFARINWRQSGWIDQLTAPFDLILANPPYIAMDTVLDPMVAKYEPHEALFAGTDGLDDYRILLPAIPALLASNGIAIFEIGFDQAESVSDLAIKVGLKSSLRLDLSGNPRALVLKSAG